MPSSAYMKAAQRVQERESVGLMLCKKLRRIKKNIYNAVNDQLFA